MPKLEYIIELIKRGNAGDLTVQELRRLQGEMRAVDNVARGTGLQFATLTRALNFLGFSMGSVSLGRIVRHRSASSLSTNGRCKR
ncbi:MAG: hypothetical protein L0Z50_18680 [Verrucomicrobiales bacterium]|nr:hypothetical protein [Verrucomicrobiales bacterium]